MLSEDIIICENLYKIYKTKDLEVLALQGLEINIAAGELMAIIGNSGSGKSTFLNMIGGLRPCKILHRRGGTQGFRPPELLRLRGASACEAKQSPLRKFLVQVHRNFPKNLLPHSGNSRFCILFLSKSQKALALREQGLLLCTPML